MKDMEHVLFYCLFYLISTTSQSIVASEMFQGAGKEPGLQIWRVEQMDLKPVPKDLHGNFYTGDAYLVLNTSPGPVYKVHSWTGKEATQDEKDTVANFMTQLVDHLKGQTFQFTEYQGKESKDFMSYFKDGIKYKTEEAALGLKKVPTSKGTINHRSRHEFEEDYK